MDYSLFPELGEGSARVFDTASVICLGIHTRGSSRATQNHFSVGAIDASHFRADHSGYRALSGLGAFETPSKTPARLHWRVGVFLGLAQPVGFTHSAALHT